MKWDNDTDVQLLVLLLHYQPGPVPWATIAEHMGCTVSAIKHRVSRLKEKVTLPDLKAGASPGISPRKSTTTTPTKGRRATTMKATKTKPSPRKAKKGTPEADTSEPETPEYDDESEPESDGELGVVKKEECSIVKMEEDDLIKLEHELLKGEKEEWEC